MGSMTLKGVYLKDYPWRDIIGTWTGFIEVCGERRLVAALEIKRVNNGNRFAPVDDGDDIDRLYQQLLDLHGYESSHFSPIEDGNGGLWLLFMAP